MKYLVAILFFFFSVTASAQIMQVNTAPGGYQFRAVKADTMLIAPRGDTTALGWTKWGVGTNGALHFRTADTTLYVRFNNKWYPVGSGGTGGGGGITNISYRAGTIVDTLYYTDGSGDTDWYYVVVRDGLLAGGIVTYAGTARTYYVSAALFRKNGQYYTTNDTTITISALASADSSRTDVFIVNTSGQATTITGTESANPLTPQIDPDTDVYLTHVTLSPSRPSAGIDTVLIYDQNAEWTTGTGGTISAVFNSTSSPYRGTLTTLVSSVSAGGYVQYTNSSTVSAASYNAIGLFIRLSGVMGNNNQIGVSFWNGSTQVSNEINLPLTKSNTTTYQGISLAMSQFTFSNQLFDRVRFRYAGSGGSYSGYRLDFVYLQSGLTVTPPANNFVQNIGRTGDDVWQQVNGTITNRFSLSDKANSSTTMTAGYGLTGGGSLAANRTFAVDTFAISTRAWRDKLADSLGAIIATKGSGTVTNFSAGDLSPLFTTSEATTTTTPALSFSLSNAGSYTVFGNQTNASAAPSFAKLNINTIDATGTPSATTYLRGDGSWSTVSSGGVPSDSLVFQKKGWTQRINTVAWNSGYNGSVGSSAAAAAVDSANFFWGVRAGAAGTTGYRNIAMGRAAMKGATTGHTNIAIGDSAMAATITGNNNIGIGFAALGIGTLSGTHNFAAGANALRGVTSGSNNIAIGQNALLLATTNSNDIAIGNLALDAKSSSSTAGDIAIGASALGAQGGGGAGDNIAIGQGAMQNANNSGNARNVAIGQSALNDQTNAADNIAIGNLALNDISTGTRNTGVGLISNNTGPTTSNDNTYVGYSGNLNIGNTGGQTIVGSIGNISATSIGARQTFVGVGRGITAGDNNIAIGYQSLVTNNAISVQDEDSSIAIGYQAGSANIGSVGAGLNRGAGIYIGYQAAANTGSTVYTGNELIAIGVRAALTQSAGDYNIAIGRVNLANTTGSDQLAIGGNGIGWIRSQVATSPLTVRQFLFNTTTSDVTSFTTSAAFEVNGTNGAFLLPRLTTTQRNALTPSAGMMIFNTTTSKFQGYDGAVWQDLH